MRSRLWLSIPPLFACVGDQIATLKGQSPLYWSGVWSVALEGSPHGDWLLSWHPATYLTAVLAYLGLIAAGVGLLPRRLARVAALAVTLAHLYGMASWLRRFWGYWPVVCVGLLAAVVIVLCFDRSDRLSAAEPSAASSSALAGWRLAPLRLLPARLGRVVAVALAAALGILVIFEIGSARRRVQEIADYHRLESEWTAKTEILARLQARQPTVGRILELFGPAVREAYLRRGRLQMSGVVQGQQDPGAALRYVSAVGPGTCWESSFAGSAAGKGRAFRVSGQVGSGVRRGGDRLVWPLRREDPAAGHWREEIRLLSLQLEQLKRILPDEPPNRLVEGHVQRLAGLAKVEVASLEAFEPMPFRSLQILPWRAELRGSYGGLARFLTSLSTALPVQVTALDLVPLEDGRYDLRLDLDSFFTR